MNQFFDINNRQELQRLLLTLDPAAKPQWGKMNAQQMVEHLAEEVRWTNGKKTIGCELSPEDVDRNKQRMVYSDAEMRKNVFIEEPPAQFESADIPAAVTKVMEELDVFDKHFSTDGATSVHPALGAMNRDEWVIYHGKHFTHHLKQFGLM